MADAPEILKNEKLRDSYPKLNAAIRNSNEALSTANTAKTNADNAVTTANAANAKSDDTQQQLNNIVINNGQSDAEVLQARGTYAVLNDRLNDTDAQLADIAINAKSFGGKFDGITDDTLAIQQAVDTGKSVIIPAKAKITQPIVINTHGQRIYGYGKGSSTQYTSQLTTDQDIEMFQVKANFVTVEGLSLYCSNANHSKKHIQSYGAVDLKVIDCRIEGTDSTTAVGSGIGFNNGAGAYGGAMGIVDKCILSHASIDIESSDVHITNSWIWANSRPHGIKVKGSSSNITLSVVDILPPRKEVPNARAGLYITGAAAQPKILGCYFDGNFGLATGIGCLIENGTIAPLVSDCHFNGLDGNGIILDSVIAPKITDSTFYNNNDGGLGSVDILLRQTFAQPLEKPSIQGNTLIQTEAITGTLAPAIKVAAGTTRNGIRITDNTIHQPGTGGGYSDVEILLEDGYFTNNNQGSLRGNVGTRTKYSTSGSYAITANDTFETITFSNNLAYEPRLNQYDMNVEGVGAESVTFRLQKSGSVNSIQLGMPATHEAFTLHYNVSL